MQGTGKLKTSVVLKWNSLLRQEPDLAFLSVSPDDAAMKDNSHPLKKYIKQSESEDPYNALEKKRMQSTRTFENSDEGEAKSKL